MYFQRLSVPIKAVAHCTAENLKISNIGWILSAEVLIIFFGINTSYIL